MNDFSNSPVPGVTAAPSPSLLKTAVRNSVFTTVGAGASLLVAFLFAGLTVRFLGTERAGYLMTLQALLALTALIGTAGLGTPAVRRLATLLARPDPVTARSVIGSVMTVGAGVGLLLAGTLVVLFPVIFKWSRIDEAVRADAARATVLVAFTFAIGQATGTWRAVYEAAQRYDLVTVMNVATALVTGVVGLWVLYLFRSMTAATSVGVAVAITRAVIDSLMVRKFIGAFPRPAWNAAELRPMLRLGGWSYGATVGTVLFTQVDRLIITSFLGSAVIPYYAIPQNVYMTVHGSLVTQSQFLFPMLASFGERTSEQVAQLNDRLRWMIAVISAGAYGGLLLIGPELFRVIIGAPFAEKMALPLLLACIQGWVHAQMIVLYFASWAVGSGPPNTLASVGNGVLVTATSLFLTPRLGYIGASVAQLWIIPIAIIHTTVVLNSVGARSPGGKWLEPYLGPLAGLLIGLAAATTLLRGTGTTIQSVFAATLLGACIGLAVIWRVERAFFPHAGRWATLTRVAGVLAGRFRQRTGAVPR